MTHQRPSVHVVVASHVPTERDHLARLLAAVPGTGYRVTIGHSVETIAPLLPRTADVCVLSLAFDGWRTLAGLADELGRPLPMVAVATETCDRVDLPRNVHDLLLPEELTTRTLDRAIRLAIAAANELQLRENENRFRLLAENASDVISRVTPEGLILYISPAARPSMGVNPEQAIGRSIYEGVHPDDIGAMRDAIARTAAGEPDVRVSYRRRKDRGGEWSWFESASRAVFHPRTGQCAEVQSVTRDVTARKMAEEAVRISEERYRLLAENSTDIISRSLPDGTLTYVSPAVERILGIPPELCIGENLFEGVHEDDVDELREETQFESGAPVVSLHRRLHPVTGEWLWLEASSRAVTDASGEVVEIHSITREVTARVRAEQDLRESEERFRAIVEASPDSIAIIGVGGEFQFVGSAFLSAFGYELGDMDRATAFSLIHEDDVEEVSETLARMIAEGPGASGEATFRVRRATGDWSLVEARGTTLAGADGTITGVVVVFRDVTLRDEAERALRGSEERYRDLFENATDILFTLDMEGKFTSANLAAEAAMGYDHWEILGMNVAEVINPDHLPIALELRSEALKHGQTNGSRELELVSKGGNIVPLDIRVRALGDPGDRQGLQGMARDITARREAEDLLQTVATNSPTGMYIVQDGRFVFVNPQFCRDTGYDESDLIGRDALGMVLDDFRAAARENAIRMLKGDHAQRSEFPIHTRAGKVVWFLETVNSITYRGARAALGTIVDITARKQAEETLHRQAFFDSLTGLPNRSHFMDRLEATLAHPRDTGTVATLFLDLDGFKHVNDTFGHASGDDVLGLVGQRLASCVRPGDVIARLGGDEFTILLEGIRSADDALAVANRVIEALREPFAVGDAQAHVTASIGIAFNRGAETSPGEILREADIALYHAKSNGKARYSVFEPQPSDQAA